MTEQGVTGLPSTADDAVAAARLRRDGDAGQAVFTEVIGRHIAALARQPFKDLLTEMIGARPTPEAIRRFADKYPDRWAQAISILGGLAGYERGVVEVNVFNIKGLSDADLMRRLAEVEEQLRARPQAAVASLPDVEDAVVVSAVAEKAVSGERVAEVSGPAAAFGGGRGDQLDNPPEV